MPITTDSIREIIDDFQKVIIEKRISSAPPEETVINFRNEESQNKTRSIFLVPLELLRYRKENGRIASSVLGHERKTGTLEPTDPDAQRKIAEFLKQKDPDKTKELKRLLLADGQKEPGIITCDGFVINGNRRRLVLEELHQKHPDGDRFARMKVVILPGKGEEGGPPTLKEIEQIENRYQLQRDGKAEYYGFDAALSIEQKIKHGFSLEEQLRDDPQFRNMSKKDFDKEVKKKEKELIQPLRCIDRYLETIGRPGEYQYISTGLGDSEGRWQAFTDYAAVYGQLQNPSKRDKFWVRETDIGAFEQAAFKMIRLRDIPNMGKLHTVMRELPKLWKHGKEEFLEINKQVRDEIPPEECVDANGDRLADREIDKKWQKQNRREIAYRLARVKDKTTRQTERETPLNLLRDSLGKLKHEDMDIAAISLSDLSNAQKIANEIKQEIKIICSDIFKSKKQLSRLKTQFTRENKGQTR